MESISEGREPLKRVFHVARHRTAAGWRTSIRIDPTPVPRGQAPVPNEIVGIEIDERGRRVMSTNRKTGIPVTSGRTSIRKGPQVFSITSDETRERPAGAHDMFDLLSTAIFAKSESDSRLARATAKLGSPAPRNGRLVYRQTVKGGTAEMEYDATAGVSTRSTGPGLQQGTTLLIEHAYKEVGGLVIRTSTRNTITGVGKHPRVMTLTLSNIIVNGKEVGQ